MKEYDLVFEGGGAKGSVFVRQAEGNEVVVSSL